MDYFMARLLLQGLHHMFLAVDFQLMGSKLGGTLSMANCCYFKHVSRFSSIWSLVCV